MGTMRRLALGAAVLTCMAVAGAKSPVAAPADLETIERECGKQLRLPPGGCGCLRERAARLKDGQQGFVAAIVTKNEAAQTRARGNLTVQELTEAGMFMSSAPAQCARGAR